MKKLNKKGFTIVELVIVIAVIAILAAVLIPTFSNVIEKANKSSAMQAARNEYELYLAEYATEISDDMNLEIVSGKYYFEVTAGQFKSEAISKPETNPAEWGKVDLSANVIKSVKATADTKPSVQYKVGNDVKTIDNFYKNKAEALKVGTAESAYTKDTEYFYVLPIADLGSADVAIYTK